MKNLIFTALIATAASLAAAGGSPQKPWDHANDSGIISGLKQVEQAQGQRFKKDDRIEYTVEATGVRVPGDIGYNDTHARLANDK